MNRNNLEFNIIYIENYLKFFNLEKSSFFRVIRLILFKFTIIINKTILKKKIKKRLFVQNSFYIKSIYKLHLD